MLSKNVKDKVLKERSNRNGGKKFSNSGGQPNSGGGGNNVKWKYKIAMLENRVSNQKRQLSYFNIVDKPGSYDEDSDSS